MDDDTADRELLEVYLCEDPYAVPEGVEPTLAEMLGIGEGQLPDR